MRYCRCNVPSPQLVEGFQVCAECGDRVPDPLMLLIVKQQREILERLKSLEKGSEESQPDAGPEDSTELIGPAEFARRTGRSAQWARDHYPELGGFKTDGKKPRYWFPADLAPEQIALTARNGINGATQSPPPSKRRRRRASNGAELLPVKGSPARERA